MFRIHHRRYFNRPNDFVLIGESETLADAVKMRVVSGDLVVDKDGRIITDDSWLFDWEKKDPKCYAQRAIAWQKTQNIMTA